MHVIGRLVGSFETRPTKKNWMHFQQKQLQNGSSIWCAESEKKLLLSLNLSLS